MSASPETPRERRNRTAKSYLHYSGMGFQMAAIIGLGTYGGWWIDQRTGWEFPLFTIVLSLGSIAMALYFLFRGTRPGN